MKRNKLFLSIILIITLAISLFACSDVNNEVIIDDKEYDIIYIYDGNLLDLSPNKYKASEEVTLPTYEKNGFVGWYDNSSLTGDMYLTIAKGSTGTQVFYAKVDRTNPIGSLSDIIDKMTNYTYTYHYEDSDKEDTYTSTNYVDNDKYEFNYEDYYGDKYTEYLYTNSDNKSVYIYEDIDGSYYSAIEGSEEYEEYIQYPDMIDLSMIYDDVFDYDSDTESFVYNDSSTVNAFTKSLIGDYEDEKFKSLSIKVENGYLSKIVATSVYSYYGEKYNYTYTVTFSNFGNVSFTIPDAKEAESEEVYATGIQVNQACFTVTQGISFDEILKSVVVTLVYSDDSIDTIDNKNCTFTHTYSSSLLGSYTVTVTYLEYTTTFKIDVVEEIDSVFTASEDTLILYDVIKTMGEYDGTVYGVTTGLNTNGGNVLVIPVDFTDYKADNAMVSNLQKAFFGTSEDTGWESLTTYYYKTSYGKANITGKVLSVYSTNKSSSYYEKMDDEAAVAEIIKAALTYYDAQINYDEFDTNNDGYIDAIYLVYTAPVDYDSSSSLYWGFTTEYVTEEVELYDNVEADFYSFLGYDFLFEELASKKNVTLNTETIIHESGHIFGFDDYYDFDTSTGPGGGIGGGDMMDYNVGDHDAFTKAIAGWITPTIVDISTLNKTVSLTLNSFGKSGDAIIIANGWNGTYFDEYYIIDFYTPDGLNALEAGYSGLFSTYGVRMYHIDARLNDPSKAESIYEVTKYNNGDGTHKLIELVEADGKNEIKKNNAYSDNDDLFKLNSTYSSFTFYKCNTKAITMKVIEMSDSQAKVEFSIK